MNLSDAHQTASAAPVSKITGRDSDLLFTGRLLDKHEVRFFRCRETGFIQTEKPFWLEEAYSDVIANRDTGLLRRCLHHRNVVSLIIRDNTFADRRFLDFGGGYGVFTRLMRDRGFDFWHHDPMCLNLFAKEYSCDDLKGQRFAAVTAFEVFEHIEEPKKLLHDLFRCTDTIIFSTLLVPDPCPTAIDQWWYFLPETGQHVSFYTHQTLRSLAGQFDCSLYTNGCDLHAFSKVPLRFGATGDRFWPKLRRALQRLR